MNRLKINLKNKSSYNTSDLRKVLAVCIRHHDEHGTWTVTVKDRKRGGNRLGYAHYNSRFFCVAVPQEYELDLVEFVFVALHEIDHCYNLRHREMNGGKSLPADQHDYTLAREIVAKLGEGFAVRKAEPKARPVIVNDRAAKALERAKSRLAKAEREQASAEKRSAKWRREVARLERYIQKRGELTAPHPKERKPRDPDVLSFGVDRCTYDLIFNERDLDEYYGDDAEGRQEYQAIQTFIDTRCRVSHGNQCINFRVEVKSRDDYEKLDWIVREFADYPNGISGRVHRKIHNWQADWERRNPVSVKLAALEEVKS